MWLPRLARATKLSLSLLVGSVTTIVGAGTLLSYCRPKTTDAYFENAERALISTYIKETPYHLSRVELDDDTFINTLAASHLIHADKNHNSNNQHLRRSSVEQITKSQLQLSTKPILILVHGWGAGLPLWAKNIDGLAKSFSAVYCLDLLGFGRSSRPLFDRHAAPQVAHDFWISSLLKWKKAILEHHFMQLVSADQQANAEESSDVVKANIQTVATNNQVVLLGHSLGGFICCAFALQHPTEINRVILAAPVGIAPWVITAETRMRKFLAWLIWDKGINPQAILRLMGNHYAKRFWDYIGDKANFRGLDNMCWEYLYHAQMAPPSGDVAFMTILTRTGWSYPLLPQLNKLQIPVRVIYGERDYVSPDFGPHLIKRVQQNTLQSNISDFVVVENAGHHMYWKDVDGFNRFVIEFANKDVQNK